MYVGADLDYRAPSADFPPSSPRFHGRSLRLPRWEPSLSPLNPPIPLFRSRRFNPGFSTQFGALHGGLYAPARLTRYIRYTHPLSSSSLFLRHPLSHVLPTYPPHTHVHGNPPISRIASSLVSTPLTLFLSRTETTVRAAYSLLLHPFRSLAFSLALAVLRSLSILSSLSSLSRLLSLFLSLSYVSVSISPSFSFPLSRLSIPESNYPRFKPSSHPSRAVPRGNTCRRS